MTLRERLDLGHPLGRALVVGGVLLVVGCTLAVLVPLGWSAPLLAGGKIARANQCGPAIWDFQRHAAVTDFFATPEGAIQIANHNCGSYARGRLGLVVALGLLGASLLGAVFWIFIPRRSSRPAPPP